MTQDDFFPTPVRDPVVAGQEILQEALATYPTAPLFALFSGGHDSLCAAHLASRMPRFTGCVHINTGIGVRQTREFVRETCAAQGWSLTEYSPSVSYRELVLKRGFPGPPHHRIMYTMLKERCLRQLLRERTDARVLLVTGVRRGESRRRMGKVDAIQRDGRRVWVAPLLSWEEPDKYAYMVQQGLARNPVVDALCMSGECLCGAFAAPGELQELKRMYPEVAQEIIALQHEAKGAGVRRYLWGMKGSRKAIDETSQPGLFSLCWSCGVKGEAL